MTIRQSIDKLLTNAQKHRKLIYKDEWEEIVIYITHTLNVGIDSKMTDEVYSYLESKSDEFIHFYESR